MGKLKQITLEVQEAIELGAMQAWDIVLTIAEQAREDAMVDIANSISEVAEKYDLTLDDLDLIFEENHEDLIEDTLSDIWEI
jgi:hypothetical protein